MRPKNGSRVEADVIVVGDRVAISNIMSFEVEWIRQDEGGYIYMAGVKDNGNPHVSTTTPGALVTRLWEDE